MDSNLIIDDEYIKGIGDTCKARGQKLDGSGSECCFTNYISILEEIKRDAISSGEVSEALEAYIKCAKRLRNQLHTLSQDLSIILSSYLKELERLDEDFAKKEGAFQ